MRFAARLMSKAAGVACFASTSIAQHVHVEADWFQSPVNGNWYGVDYSMHLWPDAEALAVSLGGHLVTIRSQAEQDWIESIFPAYQLDSVSNGGLWLGYHKPVGSWEWVSGEPVGYENWAGGQPDGSGTQAQLVTDMHPCCGPYTWDDVAATPLRPILELGAHPKSGWSWPRQYPAGNFPLYGVLADLDGDQDLDYATPLHWDNQVAVYWNDGGGGLLSGPVLDLSGGHPHQVVAIDHDQDGDNDLVVSNLQQQQLVMITNEGNSTFVVEATPVASGEQYHGAIVVDANGDQFLDIAATSISSNSAQLLFGTPGGLFAADTPIPVGPNPWFLTSADFDSDGDQDLAVANASGDSVSLLANDGSGTFAAIGSIQVTTPRGLSFGDVNNDAFPDLCVASLVDGSVEVWLNDGVAGFTLGATVPAGVDTAFCNLADLDGDSDLDLVSVAASSSGTIVSWNDGAGAFLTSSTLSGESDRMFVVAGDLNGDHRADVIVGSRGGLTVDVHLNYHDADCNGNGVPDSDDVANGTSSDCNLNGILDECEITADPGLDWNGDGVLDECSPSTYCSAATNSTGAAAGIGASGSPVISDNAFTLEAWSLPSNEFAYFLMSQGTDFVPGFGGSMGNLCLAAPIVRFNNPADGGQVLHSGAAGEVSFSPDLGDLPQGIVFQPGDTWYFQLWFRDWVGGSTSNTTDGIEVMFR